MTSRTRRLALAAAVAVLAAGTMPAAAQQAAPSNAATSNAAIGGAGGPTLENARVGARPLATANATESGAAVVQNRQGRPIALMVVGLGALLAGAIIGGDAGTIVMVGGAVIGLLGLYEYLR